MLQYGPNAGDQAGDEGAIVFGAQSTKFDYLAENVELLKKLKDVRATGMASQIRDTDMATEMVQYSKDNILAQAGQSMLAQANQSNQGALSLLQ